MFVYMSLSRMMIFGLFNSNRNNKCSESTFKPETLTHTHTHFRWDRASETQSNVNNNKRGKTADIFDT